MGWGGRRETGLVWADEGRTMGGIVAARSPVVFTPVRSRAPAWPLPDHIFMGFAAAMACLRLPLGLMAMAATVRLVLVPLRH